MIFITEIVTSNHISVYKSLVLDRNTWNNITLLQLFVQTKGIIEGIIVYKWLLVTWNAYRKNFGV